MPKYVNPNSFTFSSKAAHCARESGSAMKVSTDLKSLREIVLKLQSAQCSWHNFRKHTARCGPR